MILHQRLNQILLDLIIMVYMRPEYGTVRGILLYYNILCCIYYAGVLHFSGFHWSELRLRYDGTCAMATLYYASLNIYM